MTEASRQRLAAFDQWCLCPILRIPYTAHVTNVSVRSKTDQPPVSSLIQQHRLKLFGHIARAAASEDHSQCATSIHRSPPCWLAPPRGRPRQSWLRTIESDLLKPLNLRLHSALRRATDRPSWLATHRGNGYALRACHLMMMMMKQQSVTFINHFSTDTIHLKTQSALMSMLSSGVGARFWTSFGTSLLYYSIRTFSMQTLTTFDMKSPCNALYQRIRQSEGIIPNSKSGEPIPCRL